MKIHANLLLANAKKCLQQKQCNRRGAETQSPLTSLSISAPPRLCGISTYQENCLKEARKNADGSLKKAVRDYLNKCFLLCELLCNLNAIATCVKRCRLGRRL